MARVRTVLVVDDDPMVRLTTGKLIESAGMRVREAPSGEAALAIVAEPGAVDVVLMDLMMRPLSGEATLAAMRARGCLLPVILTSGYPSPRVPCEGVSFLGKPYRPEDLFALLDAVTE